MGKGRVTGPIPAFPKGKECHASPTTSPIPAFPKGKEPPHNTLKHSRKELPPLGEGMGRGFPKQQQL